MAIWYYVEEQRIKKIEGEELPVLAKVVFHIDIPNTNNNVGYNYRNAVLDRVDKDADGVVSAIRDLANRWPAAASGEKGSDRMAKLQTGEVYEVTRAVEYSSAYLTTAQRNAEIQAKAAEIRDSVFATLQNECQFSGYSNTVV